MIEFDELRYAAIVTITLPGMAESSSAVVILAPHDTIDTSTGRAKALRDCTLADLDQFADLLEADLWETFKSITLADLAADEQALVKITLLNEGKEPPPDPASWLDHVVVFAATAPAGTLTEPGPPTAESEEIDPAPPPAADELEPIVAVAESEPVHAEREAPAVPVSPPLHPSIRIAGKRRPLGHPTWTAVDILVNEIAFRNAQRHALSSLDREVAGVLVGPPPEKQPDGRYLVHVSDTIVARHTRMHGASVTYTPESWRYVNDRLAEIYPDESAVIVGWYHTHPGFGIFLSGMDLFIHQNFFTQLWHVALVLDPIARKSGFFCWDRQKTRVDRYELPWPAWASASW